MRFAICVEYDGAAFHGWQSQPHGQTVQDHLQKAVGSIAGTPVTIHAAGRTDAGVHALAQVAHFDVEVNRPLQAWVRGVNAHLPAAIAVRWALPVAQDFHARFSAQGRSYCYLLHNHPVRPALQHGRAGWYHRPLDAHAMNEGAAYLLGERDFSSFRAAECQARSPVKTLHRAQVLRHGEYLLFEFSASGFLHHMVRNIVGALLWVGYAKESPAWIGELLALRDRSRAAPTFMPDGLYFTGVDYGPGWSLPNEGRIIAPLPFFQA